MSGLWRWYRPDPHSARSPEPRGATIRVVNPIHPLFGRELVVRSVRRLAGVRFVVAEHPDGGTIQVPDAGVAPDAASGAGGGGVRLALFDPGQLLRVADRIALLLEKVHVDAN